MIGKTIAHYQIIEKLGEGGMGVVYKARDSRLDRFVALKVLPPNKVADPERRRRFIQEAKAASALNHPNIITIHDITESDGVECIVMEYVDGRTVDALIGHKGLPLRDALRYAAQIADALDKAHQAGIVHRDLKPSNVMVTAKGLVKVLDFGLAKLTEPVAGDEAGATATLHVDERPHTDEGMILGTVAYMSPEQAEGKKVDPRSDVFSFASMLYEMITGQRAFRGETRLSTLSAILRDEPRPMSQIVVGIPRELERIITRCLRKDPERRFQHMDDVKIALDELREESESGAFASESLAIARKRKRLAPIAAGLVALLLAGVGAAWWFNRSPARDPGESPILRRLTSDPGLTTEPSLSPDGKLVAYASDRATGNDLDIWVQQTAGGEPIRLTHNEADDREPSFSPDGSQIAFRSDREGGGIYIVSTLGGTEHKIAGNGRRPRFSPDGKWIAYWSGEYGFTYSGRGQTYVVPFSGGVPRAVHPEFSIARNPVWSPDGKYLLFEGIDKPFGQQRGRYDWWIAAMDERPPTLTGAFDALKKQKLATFEITSSVPVPGLWTQSGVTFSGTLGDSTNLWQIPVSPTDLTISAPATRLTSGVGLQGEPSITTGSSQTPSRLAFSSISENVDIWSVPMDTTQAKVSGPLLRLTHDIAFDLRPSISADGKKMVFNSNRSGNWDVWLKDLETGNETALVGTPADEMNPKITLDGSKVVYSIFEGQNPVAYVVSAMGGIPRKVCDHCYAMPWCADGRRMPFSYGRFLKLLDTETGRETEVAKVTTISAPRPSWDDHWIAFYNNIDSTHSRIFIAPLREGVVTEEPQWTAVSDGSTYDIVPDWSPDGGLMYFLSDRDGFRCLWAQRLEPVAKKPVGPAFAVQHFHSAHLSPKYVKPGERGISVARDKIVLTVAEHLGNIWMEDLGAK